MWTYVYDLNPVLLQAGPFAIRWYGLAYVVGFLFAWWYYAKVLFPKNELGFEPQKVPDMLLAGLIGLLIGARLTYMFVYNLEGFLASPMSLFAIWEGGLSFHGALIGIIIALAAYLHWQDLPILRTADRLILPIPLALFLGRIANFINGELIGRPFADGSFPICIQYPPESICRYPSQLIQALTEGLLLFVILHVLFWHTPLRKYSGSLFGAFLTLYGLFRFFTEFFRAPDAQLGLLWGSVTMGQLLCLPMILAGGYLLLRPYLRHHA